MKKGLLVGVAVGGLVYVMWRRRRAAAVPAEPEAPAWQPAASAPVAEEPAGVDATDEEMPHTGEADTDDLGEPASGEPQAAPVVIVEESDPAAAPRPQPALNHPGRRVPLTSSGFAAKPRAAAFRSSDRPQAAQARISWPGTGGPASQRPKPLRVAPLRPRPPAFRRPR